LSRVKHRTKDTDDDDDDDDDDENYFSMTSLFASGRIEHIV